MLRQLQSKLAPTLYLQISSKRVRLTDAASAEQWDDVPVLALQTDARGGKKVIAVGREAQTMAPSVGLQVVNPFDHPRMLIADFSLAEKYLQAVLRKRLGARRLSASPRLIMHPLEKLEGGLTQVEDRVFRELALGAGAHDVCVYSGPTLTGTQLDFAALKAQQEGVAKAAPGNSGLKSGALLLMSLMVMGLLVWLRAQA